MLNKFLNAYPAGEYERIQDIVKFSTSNLPFSIQSPINYYKNCIGEGNFDGAQRCLLDAFEISAQFLSGVLISLMTHSNAEFDDEVHEVMRKIVERPVTTGTWVNEILFVLLSKAKKALPGNELLKHLHEHLPKDRNVFQGNDVKQPGNILAYRNSWGHGTFRDKDVIKRDLAVVEPLLWRLLEVLNPLGHYHFFYVMERTDADQDRYRVFHDPSERKISLVVQPGMDLEENAYYFTTHKLGESAFLEKANIIKLSPFVVYFPLTSRLNGQNEPERIQFVFQSVKRGDLHKMTYVSAHGEANVVETELYKESFMEILHRILGKVVNHENYKIAFSKSFDEYKERISLQNLHFINQQKNAGKYIPELFVERSSLKESFDEFMEGEKFAFVLLGEAGVGKTNQVCHWASDEDERINLVYDGKSFAGTNLDKYVQDTFSEKKKPAGVILRELDDILEKEKKNLCLFFDAINECNTYYGGAKGNGALDLLTAIDENIVQKRFRFIKIVISCRSYTWEELIQSKGAIDQSQYFTSGNEHIKVAGFTEEEFGIVYPKYARKYNILTTPEELNADRYSFVKRRLFDPLTLKVASGNFSGKRLPIDVRQFNSVYLFEEQLRILESASVLSKRAILLLEEFTNLLWKNKTDAISLSRLYMAYDNENSELYEFAIRVFRDESLEFAPAFKLLLEEGILRVERGAKKEIRFVYERFNEYMFARCFIQNNNGNDRLPIGVDAYEKVLNEGPPSTVIVSSLRNALIIDFYAKGRDPYTIIQLSFCESYEIHLLVEDTLAVMLYESYEEVFLIIQKMLGHEQRESLDIQNKREAVEKILKKEKRKKQYSKELQERLEKEKDLLTRQLSNILRLRSIAVSIIYKIFVSDYLQSLMNTELDPKKLLWRAMSDPLPEVRDNVSTYIYYISRLDAETAMQIFSELSEKVMNASVTYLVKSSSRKELQQSYIEPACRVGLFLAIDGILEKGDYKPAFEIIDTWKKIVSRFTFNHVLIRMIWPFFRFLMSRQTVVQKEYVNNGVEYEHFWDRIPKSPERAAWSQQAHTSIIAYLDPLTPGFVSCRETFLNGYLSADALSLFLLERVLVVQGLADWENVASLIHTLSTLPENKPNKAYIEMSVIYALYQINLKQKVKLQVSEKVLRDMVEKWQLGNKGFYFAHYNDKANGGKPYKQYVLNWYATVYCDRYGDGNAKPGETCSVELIRNIITEAYRKRDKPLLYNCIENMSMLAASSGYYKTALQLFEHLINLFDSESEIREFDAIKIDGKIYEKGLRLFICSMLGTIKSYYPREVDHFVMNKLAASRFPNIDAFREEIVHYSLSHEAIGDLLTHKFGNFAIWGIVNDPKIMKFFMQICRFQYTVNNYIEWFDLCVRYCFQEVLGVRNFVKTGR